MRDGGQTTPTALNTVQFTGIAIHPTDPGVAIGGTPGNGTQRFNGALGWSTVGIYALLLLGYAGCLRPSAARA